MHEPTPDDLRLVDGPLPAKDPDARSSVAPYLARFTSPYGDEVECVLTDEGRADLLRRINEGQRAFRRTELDRLAESIAEVDPANSA
jgi:hypothetical protein